MVRENLDLESENHGLSGGSGESFDGGGYGKILSDIKSQKKDAKKEDEVKRMRLMDELLGRKSTDTLPDNEVWKKIEGYLKILQNDAQFVDTFEEVPSDIQTLYGKSYKAFIVNQFNSKNESSDEEKCRAAALLLMNFESGASPYRNLAGYENRGLWVKALLGSAHYEQFLRDKQNCINELNDTGGGKEQLVDILANCEMNYIVNNIRGSNGNLKYFGYHSSEGKGSLPSQFADRLSSFSEGRFSKSSVKESYEKIRYSDFDVTKREFERLMKSSRFPLAFGNLAKMLSLTKNEEQKSESQKAFLICMLSGTLDFGGDKDIRKQIYLWGKTLGFLPGMLAKNVGHSEQVVALLDDFSQGDFSKKVKSFFHRGDLLEGETKIGDLIEEVNNWWSVDMMYKFEQYSKSDFLTKKFPSDSALAQLQKIAKD